MIDWSLYFLFSVIGLGFAPAIDRTVFNIGADEGMMLCFLIGIVITTTCFGICRWKKYKFAHHLFVIVIIGFFSFVPGYVIAGFVGMLHLF